MNATDRLNALAATWSGVMVLGIVESTILLILIAAIWRIFRDKMSASLSYGLFLIVLIKLAVPVPITVPAGWLRYSPVAAIEGLAGLGETTDGGGNLDALGMPRPRTSTETVERPAVVPATSSPMAATSRVSVLAWLMIAWAMVVIGLTTSFIARHVAMHWRLRDTRDLRAGELPVDVSSLARRAGLRRSVPLVEVPWIASPAVWGLMSPRVLLPPRIDASLSSNGLTWVLLHEFIHIRRGDSWTALFQRLVQIIYFFHPAVWIANRMIDSQREYACDDAAMALADVPRYDCGAGFLSIVERANAMPAKNSPALGLMRSKTLIRSRLMRILDGRRPLQTGLSLGSAALLVAVMAIGLPRLRAQEELAKPAPVIREAREALAASKPELAQEKAKADPSAARVVSGVVRDQHGNPVAGVMLTGSERFQEVRFTNGALEDFAQHDWIFAETGPDGRYRFEGRSMVRTSPPIGEFGVFAYHDKGYARRSAEELAKSGDIALEAWGRVEGTVAVLGKPLANVPIRFTLDATDEHSMNFDFFEFDAKTDDQGRFVVEHVPAGVAHASTGTRFGKDPGPYGIVSSPRRMIRAGQTLKLTVGGAGRPLVGKLRVLEGIPVRLGGGRLVLNIATDPAEFPERHRDDRDRTEEGRIRLFLRGLNAYRSPEGLAHRLAERYYPLQIHDDGTFRAEEVLPGSYTLSFWIGEDFRHPIVTREIVVEPTNERRSDVPVDVGTVVITPPAAKP